MFRKFYTQHHTHTGDSQRTERKAKDFTKALLGLAKKGANAG